MKNSLETLKQKAFFLASRYELPSFYSKFSHHHAKARHIFFSNPLVNIIREEVETELKEADCLGHGVVHSRKVSWDCATLVSIELAGLPDEENYNRMIILGIIAGLFHDICRTEENHAELGAQKTARILRNYPITSDEIEIICKAIRNHEAFVKPLPCGDPISQIISDCLYDADKFRWGTDIFTSTLWHMVSYKKLTNQDLLERFPWGLEGIQKIKNTFRTQTGKLFGPEIIDQGLMLGKELYRILSKLEKADNEHDNYSNRRY